MQAIAYTKPNQPKPSPGPNGKPKLQRRVQQQFSVVPFSGRRPLDAWDKYTHALMQANESLFVN